MDLKRSRGKKEKKICNARATLRFVSLAVGYLLSVCPIGIVLFTVDNDYHGAADARFFSFFLSIADNWKSASNREREKKRWKNATLLKSPSIYT